MLAVSALLGACATAPPPPPIVLVHGAWSDASVWERVAAELRARGHTVTAVNLPGHGSDPTPLQALTLAGYVQAVAQALPADRPAVVVGHSMAGMVISQLAQNAPERVARLVYAAAYLPQNGDSLYKLSMQDGGSQVGRYWRRDDPKSYSPATWAAEGLIATVCADCSPADQRRLRATHRAEAVPPLLGTPVTLSVERFGRVPRTYVHTQNDATVSFGLQQRMVAAWPSTAVVATLPTGRLPMLTQPRAVADAILQGAR
jgi:pimeloyl-ACP methyl ester carboxylesterase